MEKMYDCSYKWERSLSSFHKYSPIHVKTLVSDLFRARSMFISFYNNITSAFIVDNSMVIFTHSSPLIKSICNEFK